jgi:hypothetical protein
MPRYEYKLVPAPEKANKIKGLKGPERFAATLEEVMNALGAEGWRYLRADTLPVEERAGLTAKQTLYRNLLVFMRELPEANEEDGTSAAAPMPAPVPQPEAAPDIDLPPDPDATQPPVDPDTADEADLTRLIDPPDSPKA